eukprot:4489481-Alexandrium_andersonii.AAC.1
MNSALGAQHARQAATTRLGAATGGLRMLVDAKRWRGRLGPLARLRLQPRPTGSSRPTKFQSRA